MYRLQRNDPIKVNDFKYVIVDTDCGGDDAQALVVLDYFVKKHNKKLVGITCCDGNASLENVIKNVLIVQSVCESSYPVYSGALCGFDGYTYKDYFFGEDGLGQVQAQYLKNYKVDYKLLQKQKAYKFIVDAAHKYKGQIALVCLAQLTNIALAYQYDPSIVDCFTNISIMGCSDTLAGLNHFYVSQFNVALDPYASYLVFNKFKNILLCSLDTTCFENPADPFEPLFKNYCTPKGKLIAKIHQHHYKKKINPLVIDPLAVCVLFAPQTVKEGRLIKINIHLKGQNCRGASVVDYFSPQSMNYNAYLVKHFNIDKLVEQVGNSYK